MYDQAARTTAFESSSDAPARAAACRPTATAFRKARVVHVSLGMNVGGMEKLLVEFARFTDRQRFDLVFVSLQERGALATEIENLRWPVYALGKPAGLKLGLVLKLARRLRQLRPHVVHTHNTAAFLYGAVAAYLARVPRILHTQHGQRFMATKRETGAFRVLSALAHRMICVSEDALHLTISNGIRADRVCVIRNGIDSSRFSYTGPNPTGPAVLVARLSPEKDVATLLYAVKHAQQVLGPRQTAFTLQIVGDGATRSQLESLSRFLRLGDTVRFLGERSDVPSLLAQASMFVLPSLTEGI